MLIIKQITMKKQIEYNKSKDYKVILNEKNKGNFR